MQKACDKVASLESGAEGDRTLNLSIANAALSQLSYGPNCLEWSFTNSTTVDYPVKAINASPLDPTDPVGPTLASSLTRR
jgi:hypothetical protein